MIDVDGTQWVQAMRRGDFAAAWNISDAQLHTRGTQDHTKLPRHFQNIWDGSPVLGKRVLVRCYHGLGDTIQFIRYAALLKEVAAEVIVWAQPQLLPLVRTVAGVDRVLPLHDGVPDAAYDVDVEVMELPFVFRSTLTTIPRDVPYLCAPRAPLPGAAPRIGVLWRAGDWETQRSMPFDALRPLWDIDGITWCSLQLG